MSCSSMSKSTLLISLQYEFPGYVPTSLTMNCLGPPYFELSSLQADYRGTRNQRRLMASYFRRVQSVQLCPSSSFVLTIHGCHFWQPTVTVKSAVLGMALDDGYCWNLWPYHCVGEEPRVKVGSIKQSCDRE